MHLSADVIEVEGRCIRVSHAEENSIYKRLRTGR